MLAPILAWILINADIENLVQTSRLYAPVVKPDEQTRFELYDALGLERLGWFSVEGVGARREFVANAALGYSSQEVFFLHYQMLPYLAFVRFEDDQINREYQTAIRALSSDPIFDRFTELFRRSFTSSDLGRLSLPDLLPNVYSSRKNAFIPLSAFLTKAEQKWPEELQWSVCYDVSRFIALSEFLKSAASLLSLQKQSSLLTAWSHLIQRIFDSEESRLGETVRELERSRDIVEKSKILIKLFSDPKNIRAIKHLNQLIWKMDYLRFLSAYGKSLSPANFPEIISGDSASLSVKSMVDPFIQEFTPFSFDLGSRTPARVQWLVAPNGHGKSSRLRAIGLLIFLADLGLPVPALQMIFTPMDPLFYIPSQRDAPDEGRSLMRVQADELQELTEKTETQRNPRKFLLLMDEIISGTSGDLRTYAELAFVRYNLAQRNNILTVIATHSIHTVERLAKEKDDLMSIASLDRFNWKPGFSVNSRQRLASLIKIIRKSGWKDDVVRKILREAKTCDARLAKLTQIPHE